jgi:hypothetical protein
LATFGKTDVGGTVGNFYGQLRGWKGNVAEGGTITKISIYLTWSTNVRVAVYSGSNPSAASLLWESDSISHSGEGWKEISVPDVEFDAGDMILAIAHSENNSRVRYDTASGGGTVRNWTYGAMPDPLGANESDTQVSIYATYTPSGATYTRTWDADVLFSKLDLLESFGVDTTLLKRNIVRNFGVDASFGAALAKEISRQIDVLLKKLDAQKTFGLDVYFGQVEAETYAKNFALDVIFAYKVRLPELWLDENGKLVLNVSKPYAWVGA